MTTIQVPIGTYYQKVNFADPTQNSSGSVFILRSLGNGGDIKEAGWQAANSVTIPSGSFLKSASLRFDSNVTFPNQPTISDEPFGVTITRQAGTLDTHTEWDAIKANGADKRTVYRTDGVSAMIFPIADQLRSWGYGRGQTSIIPELTFTIHNGSPLFFPFVQAELSNPVLQITYAELPGWTLGSTVGSESETTQTGTREARLEGTFGGDSDIQNKISITATEGEIGAGTRFGTIVKPRVHSEVGAASVTQSKSQALAEGRFGSLTTASSKLLIPLRLKAGRVSSDVGFMWIPVYLQLPEFVSDTPFEFFYESGKRIPHLIRNSRDHQIRAMVYMRPKVASSVNFFCRVG